MRLNNFVFVMLLFVSGFSSADCSLSYLPGVNLAGAEFGKVLPGVVGKDYFYPKQDILKSISAHGFKLIRFPIKWERLQRVAYDDLDAYELKLLDYVVRESSSLDVCVVVDLHNYGRYYGKPVGSDEVPIAVYLDFWLKLSRHYKNHSHVAFGLMNEPFVIKPSEWVSIAQKALHAMRDIGVANLITVASPRFSGAHEWNRVVSGDIPRSLFDDFFDPVDNYLIEIHQYGDKGSAGKKVDCDSVDAALAALDTVYSGKNARFFLGEFGGSDTPDCIRYLEGVMKIMSNSNSWRGWAYWAVGEHWGNYVYKVDVLNGVEGSKLNILKRNLIRN